MKTIILPADTEHLYLDEVAHLIADCLNPEASNDPDGLRYKGALEAVAPELEQAANSGALRTRHPQTLGHLPPVSLSADPLDRLLNRTYSIPLRLRVVTVPDFAAYVADRGMTVVMEVPAQSPATPAPVVAVSSSGGTLTVWTSERKAEAQAYRAIHGLKKTALHYKVSEATISKHIPAGKAAATKTHPATPWGGLGKRR